MVNAGLPKRISLGGVDYEAAGTWSIKTSFNKKEATESTYTRQYQKVTPMAGEATGPIAIQSGLDRDAIRDAIDSEFFIETAAGEYYSGTMTFVGEGEENLDEGTFQVELSGYLKKQ